METMTTPTDTTIVIGFRDGVLTFTDAQTGRDATVAHAWPGRTVEWTAESPVDQWVVILEENVPFGHRLLASSGKHGGTVEGRGKLEAIKYWVVGIVEGEMKVIDPILVIRDQT